jgi:hypothetical protein
MSKQNMEQNKQKPPTKQKQEVMKLLGVQKITH